MLIKRVWIDSEPEINFDPKTDCVDVLVEMEDCKLWQAHFVTLAHLQQEMALSLEVTRENRQSLAPRQFLTLETPHVIVDELTADVIEDVVDNLMALGIFESIFAECTPEPTEHSALNMRTIPPSEIMYYVSPQ